MASLITLSDLPWFGGESTLAGGIVLRASAGADVTAQLSEALEDLQRTSLETATHVLEIEKDNEFGCEASELVQIFLLSMWIVAPTTAHARFRFERSGSEVEVVHYLDRFGHLDAHVVDELTPAQLASIAGTMKVLVEIARTDGRLFIGAMMTVAACEAVRWRVSYLCHASSLEALLTCGHRYDITKNLSEAYACIVAETAADRALACDEFRDVYGVRSEIVHGRLYGTADPDQNLDRLAGVHDVARRLWRVIVSERAVLDALEGDDAMRSAFMAERQEEP